jgi:hypothetical protein
MADEGNPGSPPLVDSVREQVDKMYATVAGLDSFVSKIFESRQAYYEKLTLLNGATLTLLFSAMGLLAKSSSPTMKAQITWPVFAGCWMLIASIILCIVHNYINLYYLFHGNASVFAFSVNATRRRLRNALISVGASLNDGEWVDSGKSAIHSKGVSLTERLCYILGILAQGLTIAAYIEFLTALHQIFLSL